MKELSDKIRFEFDSHVKQNIEYDAQETTMYVVRISELPTDLMCEDDEIDGYDFVNKVVKTLYTQVKQNKLA